MKKITSIFLCLIMVFAVLTAMPFSASAAEQCFSIKISGTQFNSAAKDELDRLNNLRAQNGLNALEADSSLENFAQNRAAQAVLGGKVNHSGGAYEEICSDGVSVSSIYPDYGTGVFTSSRSDNSQFKADLDAFSTQDYAELKSIGIAVFKYQNSYSYYAIISKSEKQSLFTDFSDKNYENTISVQYGNIRDFKLTSNPKGKKYYNLSVEGYFTGFYSNYVKIPNSQLVYKSSKPKIFKIKNTKGYVKGKGKYSIKLYDKYSTLLTEFKNLKCKVNNSPQNFYLESKKKKQLYARWETFDDGSGYQVQYCLKKNMKGAKIKTVNGTKKKGVTIKKLKSGKKYYVRVRAYLDQGDGERLYTKWSSKKSVKVK